MTSIPSIRSLTLDLPPSCIAFCPTQPQYFVVGTYHLHAEEQPHAGANSQPQVGGNADSDYSEPQKRTGSLILFQLEGDTITQIATEETEYAILDVQWSPHSRQHGELLAVAASTGIVAFYRLQTGNGETKLVISGTQAVADPSILVLSIAWHPYRQHVFGITLADGRVCVCEGNEGEVWDSSTAVSTIEIYQHELEAWTLAFMKHEPINVLSGGDDINFSNSSIDDLGNATTLWQDRKLHQAGITAILPLSATLAVTGSYDDHIRLISFPAGGRRQVLAELNLGGGVWRLKLLQPSDLPKVEGTQQQSEDLSAPKCLTILASCMHAGSRIVRVCKGGDGEYDEWTFDVMAKFEEHESMNYGSDVQRGSSSTIISTSFYDKLLCLWHFDTRQQATENAE